MVLAVVVSTSECLAVVSYRIPHYRWPCRASSLCLGRRSRWELRRPVRTQMDMKWTPSVVARRMTGPGVTT